MKAKAALPIYQKSVHKWADPPLAGASDRRASIVKPTAENPMIISASELRDFMRCRVMWNWRHQARIEPVTRSENLAIGTVVHAGKEAWYKLPFPKRTVKAMLPIARKIVRDTGIEQLSTDNRNLCEAMLNGYAAWAIDADKEIGLREAFPEEEFDLPLTPDKSIRVRGKIDCRFAPVTRKKTMSLLESKTKGQIRVDMVEMNLQLSVYLWALRQLFPKFKNYEAHYQVLRKQMPGPRVKADLFYREAVTRTDDEVDQWAIDTARVALDMLDAAIYPSPMDSCSWGCDYKMPCLLRGDADELKHVLTSEYQLKAARR
jgi:hypothetical protein